MEERVECKHWGLVWCGEMPATPKGRGPEHGDLYRKSGIQVDAEASAQLQVYIEKGKCWVGIAGVLDLPDLDNGMNQDCRWMDRRTKRV